EREASKADGATAAGHAAAAQRRRGGAGPSPYRRDPLLLAGKLAIPASGVPASASRRRRRAWRGAEVAQRREGGPERVVERRERRPHLRVDPRGAGLGL